MYSPTHNLCPPLLPSDEYLWYNHLHLFYPRRDMLITEQAKFGKKIRKLSKFRNMCNSTFFICFFLLKNLDLVQVFQFRTPKYLYSPPPFSPPILFFIIKIVQHKIVKTFSMTERRRCSLGSSIWTHFCFSLSVENL